MGKINKEWHARNRMPKNPTRDQRIDWHLNHAKNCACRETPKSVSKEIARRRSGSASDRQGYSRRPLSHAETNIWEAEAAWPRHAKVGAGARSHLI